MSVRLPLLVALILVAACGGADDTLPDEFLGRWETDHEKFQGRFLILSREEICFGASAEVITPYAINSVERKKHGPLGRPPVPEV